MKKLFTKFACLLVAVLCCAGMQVRADELTINESETSSTSYAPIYGLYADTQNQISQCLYLADDLSDMAGSTISTMKFYLSSTPTKTLTSTYEVTLAEVESTDLSSAFADVSEGSVVYTGLVEFVNDEMLIEFDDSYNYNGGNLVVQFKVVQKTSDYATINFTSKGSATGMARYNNGTGTGNVLNYQPKVTFEYTAAGVVVCPKPRSLTVSGITHNAATIDWTSDNTAWQICLNGDEDNLIDAGGVHPYTLEDLTPLTDYTVKVRTVCGDDEYSDWTSVVNFKTTAVASPVGDAWSDDFEGESSSWDLINGTLTNAWVWGTAAHNGEGTHALYISNDGGTTNAYTISSAPAVVYATQLFQFEDAKYDFKYDWLANGESTYDFLRVALVPVSVELTAGTSLPASLSASNMPTGWIALDGGSKLNQSTTWQTKEVAATVPAGNYYLALIWRNDNGGGTNPPAAVDNISITKLACPYDITDVAIFEENIDLNEAKITWEPGESTQWEVQYSTTSNFTAETTNSVMVEDEEPIAALEELTASTKYYVRVRAYCGGEDYGSWSETFEFVTLCDLVTEFPWSENFDSYTAVSSTHLLPICWSYINNTTSSSYNYYPTIYANSSWSTYSNSAPNCMYLNSYYNSYTDYGVQPEYAILPEMEGLDSKRVVFYAKGYNASSTLKVGYTSDPADASLFSEIEELELTTAYQKFTVNLSSAEGHYIVFMIDAANSSRTTNGVYVDDIVVEEIPNCLEPTELEVVSVTTNSATLNWTNGGSETAWDIYYATENVTPTAETTPSITNTDTKVVEGLTAATLYYVWVRAHCSDSEQSPWSESIMLTTECEAISAATTWLENFDSYTGSTSVSVPSNYPNDKLPLCWQFLNRAETSSSYPVAFISSYSSYTVSGNCLFFKTSSETDLYAILPEFSENISDLMLTFTYRNEGTGSTNGTLHAGYMTDPNDESTFTSVLECNRTTTLTEKEVLFEDAPEGSYIAFKVAGGSSDNYYLSIDNVQVEPKPSCFKPSGLTAADLTAHTATLSWTNGTDDQTAWQIAYSTLANFDPTAQVSDSIVDADANPFILTGLEQNTTYYAYVRAVCGNEDMSKWCTNKETFTTLAGNMLPTNLAVDMSTVTAGEATITWNTAAANTLHQSFDLYYSTDSELPENPEGDNLITGITEPTYQLTLLTAETTYYVWVRDFCGTDGYSAWTASINFTTLANCPVPGILSADNIQARTADIAWEIGANDSYDLRYRQRGEVNTIFSEGFENGIGDWTLVDCESTTQIVTTAYSGEYGFRFRYGYNPPQYLISPEIEGLNTDATLTFYYKRESSSYSEPFMVGTSSTTNETSAFTFGDEITVTNMDWNKYEASVPAGTKYICIRYNGYNQYYLYIDDITITTRDEAGEWTIAHGTDAKSLQLTELTPQTEYEAQVRGICGETETEWSEDVLYFTTIPSCTAPVIGELAGDVINTPEGITLPWIAGNGETRFEYACVEHNAEVTEWTLLDENVFSVTITGKTAGTTYDLYVRAYCSETDQSEAVKQVFTPYCPAPTAVIVTDITTNTATISWTAAEGITKYQYVVLPAGAELDWTDAEIVEDVTANVDALLASTSYVVYVRSYYNEQSQSSYSTQNFATECEAINLPYAVNFPDVQAMPACWTILEGTSSNIYYYSYYTALCMYGGGSTSVRTVVMPEMIEDVNTMMLTINARSTVSSSWSTYGTLTIGALTDPSDASTFVEIATIDQSSDFVETDINLATAPEGAKYIAIRYAGGTSNYGSAYIKSVALTTLPTCYKATDLTVSDITTTTATLNWTAPEQGGNLFNLVVIDGEDQLVNTQVEGTSYIVPNLTAATTYDWTVSLVTVCDEENMSAPYVANIVFTSDCEALVINQLNSLEEDFEGTTFAPTCWESIASDTYAWSASTQRSLSGTKSAYSGYYGDVYLVLPEMTISDGEGDVQLAFYSYNTYANSYDKNSVVLLDGDIETELWTAESVTSSWEKDSVNLNAYKGQTIKLAFKYEGDDAHGWYIDDVTVGFETPEVHDGIDDATSNRNENIIKFIRDNQVFIIREGKVYTILGSEVK